MPVKGGSGEGPSHTAIVEEHMRMCVVKGHGMTLNMTLQVVVVASNMIMQLSPSTA